jgi:hypothetical protein
MQRHDKAGAWLCQVQYRRPGELSSHIDTFPAERVRPERHRLQRWSLTGRCLTWVRSVRLVEGAWVIGRV